MSDSDEISGKLLSLESKVENILSMLKTHINEINENLDIVDDNFQSIDKNFEVLNDKIDSLHQDSSKEFGIVKSELKKIQAVTSYADKFDNLKVIKK